MTSIVSEMGHKLQEMSQSHATCTWSVRCRLIRVLYRDRFLCQVTSGLHRPGSYIIPNKAWRCQADYEQRDCSSCVCFFGVWESHRFR